MTCEIGNPLTNGSSVSCPLLLLMQSHVEGEKCVLKVEFGMRIGVQSLTSAGADFVVSVRATRSITM